MSLVKKVRAVEKIFNTLDKNMQKFNKTSGIHCIDGCYQCCMYENIEASVIEFLPLAYHLEKTGEALTLLDKIESINQSNGCCLRNISLKDAPGNCSKYQYRGLVCRLFGFSATTNKEGEAVMFTCKLIKSAYPNQVLGAQKNIHIPYVQEYYSMLYSIDLGLSYKSFSINTAIKMALEHVLLYSNFKREKAL